MHAKRIKAYSSGVKKAQSPNGEYNASMRETNETSEKIKENDQDKEQSEQEIFKGESQEVDLKNVSKEEILYEANKFLVSIKNVDQRFRPQRTTFEFYDKDELFVLDCKRDQCFFSKKESISNISGILPSEEFHFFLKYPWGADTLNITSCFEIKNKVMWRKILEFKDMIYAR